MTASATPPTPPTVLVTGAESPLARAVIAALSGARHTGDDLTDPTAVAPLVQDAGAIVHLAPLSPPAPCPKAPRPRCWTAPPEAPTSSSKRRTTPAYATSSWAAPWP